MTNGASFEIVGEDAPATPLVLSVPHAGRDYPAALLARLRVPPSALIALEDRFVDVLAGSARQRETMIVARRPRAWIDLNRGEDERDPRVDEGAAPSAMSARSAKVRSGLGLVPRRATGNADIWRSRFTAAEIEARIEADHRPYHLALARLLEATRRRFGVALLVDVHSMPPLRPASPGAAVARVVLGDRFGRTAAARLVARAEAEAAAGGVRVAINAPYAGGHVLSRHADPAGDVHAIQVEIDRSLYLAAGLQDIGRGFDATAALLRRVLSGLADEILSLAAPSIAAE